MRPWDKAVKQAGTFGVASRTFTLNGTPLAYDRVTLWYQNLAFDFIVGARPESKATILGNIRDHS